MKMLNTLGLTAFLISSTALAGATEESLVEENFQARINSAMSKIIKSEAIEADIEREIYLDMMGETINATGKLYFSKGRLRIEINGSEKTLMVLNDKTIWIQNELPEGFGDKYQTTKMKVTKNLKKKNALLALIFDNENIWKDFKLKKQEKEDKADLFYLSPKNTEQFANIDRLMVKVTDEIKVISYWDGLDNKTSYEFKKIKKLDKIDEKLFDYKPPEGKFTEI